MIVDDLEEGGEDGRGRVAGTRIHLAGIGADLSCAPAQARDGGIIAIGEVDDLALDR